MWKKIVNFFKELPKKSIIINFINIIIVFFNNKIIKKQDMKNIKSLKSIIKMLLNLINFDKIDVELTIDYNAEDPQQWDIFLEIWYNGKLIKVFEFTKQSRKVAINNKVISKLPNMEIEKFVKDEIKKI